MGPFVFSNCRLNLDKLLPLSRFTPPGPTDEIECDSCQVSYSGGPVPLLRLPGLKRITLKKCTFEVEASNESPLDGKTLISELLSAKDKRAVDVSASSGE
jgi:hypothetical protein